MPNATPLQPKLKEPPTAGAARSFLVTISWSSRQPEQHQQRAEADAEKCALHTIAELWPELCPDVAPTCKTTKIKHAYGSAIAGLDEHGHKLFEDVLLRYLSQADVWIVMSSTGFAADLESWQYALNFMPEHCLVFFRYGIASFQVLTKAEIAAYVQNPASFWDQSVIPPGHVFMEWAGVATRQRLQVLDIAADEQLLCYQNMRTDLVLLDARRLQVEQSHGAQDPSGRHAVDCPFCVPRLLVRSLREYVLHVLDAHNSTRCRAAWQEGWRQGIHDLLQWLVGQLEPGHPLRVDDAKAEIDRWIDEAAGEAKVLEFRRAFFEDEALAERCDPASLLVDLRKWSLVLDRVPCPRLHSNCPGGAEVVEFWADVDIERHDWQHHRDDSECIYDYLGCPCSQGPGTFGTIEEWGLHLATHRAAMLAEKIPEDLQAEVDARVAEIREYGARMAGSARSIVKGQRE